VHFLAEVPKNYVGEYYDSKMLSIPPGSWYYDLKTRQLVYAVQRSSHFLAGDGGKKEVRFETGVVYNNWLFAADAPNQREVGGITFKEVGPYSWAIK